VYLLSGGTDGRSRLSHDVVNCRVKVVVVVVASRELRDAQRVVGVWQSATDVRHYHTSQSDHDFKSGPSNEITLGSTGDIRRELKVRFFSIQLLAKACPVAVAAPWTTTQHTRRSYGGTQKTTF